MGTRLRITGGVVVALLVVALLASWMVDQAKAKSGGMEAQERPALFVGNESLLPINFIKHGKPSGIVIELAEAGETHASALLCVGAAKETTAEGLDLILQDHPRSLRNSL